MAKKIQADFELPELPLGRHLATLTRAYYGALTHKLKSLDIDKHFSLLLHIETNPCCTQQYLSEKLHIDKTAIVRILDWLSEKDYIIRTVNRNDRREHYLKLTAKGKKAIPKIKKAIEDLNKEAVAGLNKQEQKVFYTGIAMICKNLHALPADPVEVNFSRKKMNKK